MNWYRCDVLYQCDYCVISLFGSRLGKIWVKKFRPLKRRGKKQNYLMFKMKEKALNSEEFRTFCGGDKRDRTADLLNAIQALSQLSYTPKFSCAVRQLSYYNSKHGVCQEKILLFIRSPKNKDSQMIKSDV